MVRPPVNSAAGPRTAGPGGANLCPEWGYDLHGNVVNT